MPKVNDRALPFANAATIVRANQKDSYFENSFQSHVQDVLHVFKGQRFVNMHPEEIAAVVKALYLVLTTLIGARTLGEEYVDLTYVNRSGKRLPKFASKLLFILSYSLLPYFITKIVRRYNSEEKEDGWITKFFTSYTKVLDTITNVHIAIFYFYGEYYSLSKRVFGLKYVFGHNKDPKKISQAGNYSFLGALASLQFGIKSFIQLKSYSNSKHSSENEINLGDTTKISKIDQLNFISKTINENEGMAKTLDTDLSDPNNLPYIPESSRSCMLCLSQMTNPSAALCGHLFCWDCIVDWIREHPECPLCRQQCSEQNLLPLK